VVVHIGDSFALAGFAQALKPRLKALGVRYDVKAETSSFTTTWSGKIEAVISNTQPDLVIINLGANEVANVDPAAHAPAVRHIIAAIKGRPCVWVSPPSWRKDTGIQDVIRQNSAPCRYFDSDKLVPVPIPRQKDHIHPTEEGGAIWAEAFWTWLQQERAPVVVPTRPEIVHGGPHSAPSGANSVPTRPKIVPTGALGVAAGASSVPAGPLGAECGAHSVPTRPKIVPTGALGVASGASSVPTRPQTVPTGALGVDCGPNSVPVGALGVECGAHSVPTRPHFVPGGQRALSRGASMSVTFRYR
jgi:hypothetical protein